MADEAKQPFSDVPRPAADPQSEFVNADGVVSRDAVLRYLNRVKAGDSPLTCPISGHNEWVVMPRLIHMMMSRTKSDPGWERTRTGGAWQYIEVVCGVCGYSFLLNHYLIIQLHLDKPNV